jgi:hypothetical protein
MATYRTQLLLWLQSAKKMDLACLLADEPVSEATLNFFRSLDGAPEEKKHCLEIKDFDGARECAQSHRGDPDFELVLSMLSAIPTNARDLTSPCMELPMQRLQSAMEQKGLAFVISPGQARHATKAPTTGVSGEQRSIDFRTPQTKAPSKRVHVTNDISDMDANHLSGGGSGSGGDGSSSRSRTNKSELPKVSVEDILENYKHELIELLKQRQLDEGSDFELDAAFGRLGVAAITGDLASQMITDKSKQYPPKYLINSKTKASLKYAQTMAALSQDLQRFRRRWIKAQQMKIAGCREFGNILDAQELLRGRARRYYKKVKNEDPVSSSPNTSKSLFSASSGLPDVGQGIMLTNGAPVKIEQVRIGSDGRSEIMLRHVDGELITLSPVEKGGGVKAKATTENPNGFRSD